MSVSLIVLVTVFLSFILAGMPIAWAMLCASVSWIIFTGNYHFLQIIPQRLFEGIDVFVLLAIPLFVLTGEIINSGKVTDKLINMADVCFGRLRGGLAQVNIATSILFSGITGTAVGDVAALGRVFIPAMTRQGFPAAYAAAVTAASSIIGPMVPPSLVIIVFGAATGMSIGAMFAACVIPGILIGVMQMLLVAALPQAASRRRDIDRSFPAVMQATRSAIVPLMIPLIIVVCIITGIATPTEAGAIAAAYTLLITLLLYRTLRLDNLPGIFSRAMVFSSQLMILVGCGSILSWILAVEHVPDLLNSFLVSMDMPAITSLVFLNVFLLIAGMFIDTAAAIILFSPLLLAAATNVGIHPLHFSVIMILNLNIGLLTPPLGICLLTAETIAGCDLFTLIKAIAPLLLVNVIALVIVTYIPEISLFLPGYLGF